MTVLRRDVSGDPSTPGTGRSKPKSAASLSRSADSGQLVGSMNEWSPRFDDPILAQSALDRLVHDAYQVVIEGESFRKRQRPGEQASTPARPAVARGGAPDANVLSAPPALGAGIKVAKKG